MSNILYFWSDVVFRNMSPLKINKHFKGAYSEVESLPSADYYFVARLVSNDNTRRVLDERVLDLVIERKCVTDLAHCLVKPSRTYRPLSFFEAQMYKVCRSLCTLYYFRQQDSLTAFLVPALRNSK